MFVIRKRFSRNFHSQRASQETASLGQHVKFVQEFPRFLLADFERREGTKHMT